MIPYLLGQGLRVSVIKHAHHEFDVDVPGKDSWVHRQSGATEVLVSSTRRWALMHELRGAGEPRLPELLAKMSPVDLVIIEGFKREPHRKIEVHRIANDKPLLFPEDPDIVGIATDAAVETTLPMAHLDDIEAVAALLQRSAMPVEDVLAKQLPNREGLRGKMAQLSDDCFAFGGPMMSVDEAVGIIAARVTAVEEIETVALGAADGRVLARDDCRAVAAAAVHQFRGRRLCGGKPRSAAGRGEGVSVTGRMQAGASASAAIQPGHAMRIFTGAPMPEGADTVFMQEDVRIDDDGRVVLPAGLKPGANVRPAGEDIPAGHAALAAGRRLRPQDVALAAAFGLTQLEVVRRIRVAVFSTGDELVSPGETRAPAQLFDSNRFMLMAMLARLGCEVSDLGILRDERASLAEALQKAAGNHDLILTTGGVSTGEEDHVKAAVESAGKLVLWRMAIKPGRPVAMGIIGGTPFIGLPGNPVASFVTFVHVVRPTVLALSGAAQQPLVPMPVRAAFSYRKKIARREYVRVNLARGEDGMLEAVKFPREGAGLLSSLVDTDGLVELGEEITRVEPGQTVGFLSYSSLI